MGRLPREGNCTDDHHRARVVPLVEGESRLPSRLFVCALTTIFQDEAFEIWSEWSSFYRPGSEERRLLEGVRDNRWLVNVVHHDYRNTEALWVFLLE
jgi:methylenetetrahydrofolate reductase (NADPH)